MTGNPPLDALRYHVSGAVERGDAEPAVAVECPGCGPGFRPSHDGSPRCESGSLASGGTHAHCTCDACF